MASIYTEGAAMVSGGGLVVAAPSPRMRGAVLINVETTPLSLLIFHLGDTGELWHQPGMPLIKAGTHLPLPAVNKTPLMAFCPGFRGRGLEPGTIPTFVQMSENKLSLISDIWALSLCDFISEEVLPVLGSNPARKGGWTGPKQVKAVLHCSGWTVVWQKPY